MLSRHVSGKVYRPVGATYSGCLIASCNKGMQFKDGILQVTDFFSDWNYSAPILIDVELIAL
jgi:hypothetical protein